MVYEMLCELNGVYKRRNNANEIVLVVNQYRYWNVILVDTWIDDDDDRSFVFWMVGG